MDESKWERYAGISGFVFVVLVLVGSFLPGSPPATNDSAAKIGKYFQDNDDAIKCAAFISGLAAIAFLVFLAGLYGKLRTAERDGARLSLVALAGGVVSIGLVLVAFSIMGTVAILVDEGGAEAAKFYYVLFNSLTGLAGLAFAALVGATALVAFRTRVVPTWLAWLSAASAVLWIPGGLTVASDSDAAFGIGFAAFILFLVWVLATSFVLFRPQTAAATR
jgi:hypothetical protein